MGLFKKLFFPPENSTVRYINLTKRLKGTQCPETDTAGQPVANIFRTNISGVSHINFNCNPQKIIPKLHNGDRLAFVPCPENEFDNTAVKVVTMNGKYIGWLPAGGTLHERVFRRLMDNEEIWINVYDHGYSKKIGLWWCEIWSTYYATDYDLGLSKK